MVALLATCTTGIGIIISIVLLVLISSEKKLLLENSNNSEISDDLSKLKTAKTLSIINLVINFILIFLAVILIIVFIFFAAGDPYSLISSFNN